MAMGRHDLVRIVDAVGDVQRRCGRALRSQARIDQDERAALRGLRLDERRRAMQQGLDLPLVLPDEGYRLAALPDLAVLVISHAAIDNPPRPPLLSLTV